MRFSKSVTTGKLYVNISEKGERGQQLTCGLISCVFKISVHFILGSLRSVCVINENSYTTYF